MHAPNLLNLTCQPACMHACIYILHSTLSTLLDITRHTHTHTHTHTHHYLSMIYLLLLLLLYSTLLCTLLYFTHLVTSSSHHIPSHLRRNQEIAFCKHSTALYSTLLCSTLLCSTLLYSTLLYSTLLYTPSPPHIHIHIHTHHITSINQCMHSHFRLISRILEHSFTHMHKNTHCVFPVPSSFLHFIFFFLSCFLFFAVHFSPPANQTKLHVEYLANQGTPAKAFISCQPTHRNTRFPPLFFFPPLPKKKKKRI